MDIKQELRYVIKKHKDDELATFETNISLMADACLKEIIKLEEDIELKLDLIKSLQEEIDWLTKEEPIYNFREEVEKC